MLPMKNILRNWLPLAVVITILLGATYGTIQQALRISANDPQIQIAEDAANALTNGQSIGSVVPAAKIDIAQSLAPYVVVFDDSGKAIASSGFLRNQLPALPTGVFEYVRQHGENRLTWQPEPGVRSATVVTRYTGAQSGFVMAGRSLREVESRDSNLQLLIGLGWLGTLCVSLVTVAASQFIFSTRN